MEGGSCERVARRLVLELACYKREVGAALGGSASRYDVGIDEAITVDGDCCARL